MKKEEKVFKIVDIAISVDNRVAEKGRKKVEKYQDLGREIARIWSMRKVEVIPVVVGALRTMPKTLSTNGSRKSK